MMGSSTFLLCCFVILSLYSLSQHTSYSLDFKPTRKLSMSASTYHESKYKMQVADETMEGTPAKEDFMTLEFTSNSYSTPDLVYHTDYHGVTTHPTPKHP